MSSLAPKPTPSPHATATTCFLTCCSMAVRAYCSTSSSPIPSCGLTSAFEIPLHLPAQRLCAPPTMCLLQSSCPSAFTMRCARRSKIGATRGKRRILYRDVWGASSRTKRSTRSRFRMGMKSPQTRQSNGAPFNVFLLHLRIYSAMNGF